MNDELIRAVDALEERARSYVTLAEVEGAIGRPAARAALEAGVLLVDRRQRPDATPVLLCRLNRRHPDVVRLASW
ncbi:MAG: hypothetical protein M3336_04490 [Chloroflexota bacterium]|nr:hypothetical protein [Chloroflexota bacterium]